MDKLLPYLAVLTMALMVFALMFSLYNVAKYFRTVKEVRRAWHRARARFFFGIFMVVFSINQIVLFPSTVTYIFCFLLIAFGLMNINYGRKAMKYFESHFKEEDQAWAEFNKKKRN